MTKLIGEWLDARTRKDGKCRIWVNSFNGNQPQARINKVQINVRRVIYEEQHGKPPHAKWAVVCSCETEGCVEPTHLKAVSRKYIGTGKPATIAKRKKLAELARARGKLTPEQVQAIRANEESINKAAERFGVHRRSIWAIRQHEFWKDYSSPFAGLTA